MPAPSHRLGNAFNRLALKTPLYSGMPLAAAFYVAWPYQRVQAIVDCRRREKLPFTWRYVLSSICCGLSHVEDIHQFLGVPLGSVEQWLEQLDARGAVARQPDGGWQLTALGKEYLDQTATEKTLTLPARMTWDGLKGQVSDLFYEDLRAPDRHSSALELDAGIRMPPSHALSLPECQRYLDRYLGEYGEAFDGAELLYVRYARPPMRAVKLLPALVYGFSPQEFEVRIWDGEDFDHAAAQIVRSNGAFNRVISTLFEDIRVIEFLRRAGATRRDALRELGYDTAVFAVAGHSGLAPRIQLEAGAPYRTLPGQGITFVERALLEAATSIRMVITEGQLVEWERFRELLGQAVARGVECEIVLAHRRDERPEQMGRKREQFRHGVLETVPVKGRRGGGARLKVLGAPSRYAAHWVPLVICDEQWIWCGTEMLAGSSGPQAHFGFYARDSRLSGQIIRLISDQVLLREEESHPTVDIKTKRRRTYNKPPS